MYTGETFSDAFNTEHPEPRICHPVVEKEIFLAFQTAMSEEQSISHP